MKKYCTLSLSAILLFFISTAAPAQTVKTNYSESGSTRVFFLSNDKVDQEVVVSNGLLQGDDLEGQAAWLAEYHNAHHGVQTDGDYALKLMWTDWSAPGKEVNADVQITLTKKDYQYTGYEFTDVDGGGKELHLLFRPFDRQNTVDLELTYQLLPGKFYSRRKITLTDSVKQNNWIQTFISREGAVVASGAANNGEAVQIRAQSAASYQQVNTSSSSQIEENRIIKKGAFGQPCAADFATGGVFFGVEFPAATSTLKRNGNGFALKCEELIGTTIKKGGVESQWVVEGLAPNHYVKDWFFNYVPDIRVTPNRPYALYNSWYDLRSPEYPGVQPDHVMNQKNISHIIDLFKKNMIDKYGIHLDAFVLDDGWDVYDGAWQLRKTTFPNGLKPISDELKPLGTTLGIWYGPTGGYSFRMRRINWMHAHGYEVSGYGSRDPMMCIAGKNYSDLFRKRTTDMVANDGVGYFKWDGIQFSCSDPDHGHPVGYLSRRAVLESIIDKCNSVRKANPNTFLNITSGTWLSPWWMKYANQIWMQGQDYGYADVPSVNERDGAITYRDFVLYDDLRNQDVWYPISNMMTHGIIKGNLEKLGGDDDPLDRFADDVMMYFARGVSMYELYISPDLLTPDEWNVISKSLQWAKDRFDVLEKVDMVGGDPTRGAAYGYVHFNADKGIFAVRNPEMKANQITLKLDPAKGLDPAAHSLVVEQVYPYHKILPGLYAAGTELSIPLKGYETEVYEVYPLDQAGKPLVTGLDYEVKNIEGDHYRLNVLQANGDPINVLNPEKVKQAELGGKAISGAMNGDWFNAGISDWVTRTHATTRHNEATAEFDIAPETKDARVIFLVRPDSAFEGRKFPDMQLLIDGKEVQATRQVQQGRWAAYSYVLTETGKHSAAFRLGTNKDTKAWKGGTEIWITGQQLQGRQQLDLQYDGPVIAAPQPPDPFYPGYEKESLKIGEVELSM